MNKLVTVFGASGQIGRHTVRALAKEGWRIRAVTRRPNLANYLLPAGHVGQIQLFKGNVRDDASVAKALSGADAVVNLTGILFSRGRQNFTAIHEEAARRIAHAAREAGAADLVQMSAIGADPKAESAYARTKARGEWFAREEFGNAVIIRPSIVFGPEDQFFNRFASMARFVPALPLIGGGRTKFQPVFVADIAEAIARVLADPTARGKTYKLGGPAIYTFEELLRFILRQIGRQRLLVPMPYALASLEAFFLQMPSYVLPVTPLLTTDQVKLLKTDNVVGPGALTFADLDIIPRSLEAVAPSYLWRFRPKGQFQQPVSA